MFKKDKRRFEVRLEIHVLDFLRKLLHAYYIRDIFDTKCLDDFTMYFIWNKHNINGIKEIDSFRIQKK